MRPPRCGEGLEVPALAESTRARLREFLPASASVTNPADIIATATAEHYGEAIRIVGSDADIDALVVIFIPSLVTQTEDVARAIAATARELKGEKPVLAVFMSARGVPDALRTAEVQSPSYAFPEDAAIALARAARYGQWLARPVEAPPRVSTLAKSRSFA